MAFSLVLDCQILKSCVYVSFWIYLALTLLSITTSTCLICLTVFSLCIFFAVQKYSLPRGDEMLAKEILGKDLFDLPTKIGQDEVFQEGQDGDFTMRVVAHRFGSLDAPENTIEALTACHNAGCRAVEFDLSVTKDNVPIIFHDDTVDRLTNDVGLISQKSWNDVSSYDVSINHPFREKFKEAKVPRFEQVIEKCMEYDMRIFIDIKDSKKEVIDSVCAMYEKYPMLYRRAIVSSFNPLIIYQIRQRKPSVVGCMAWRPYFYSCQSYDPDDLSSQKPRTSNWIYHYWSRLCDCLMTWAFFNFVYKIVGLSAVLIHKDTITREMVYNWRSKGIRCLAWTVNLPSEKIHFSKNLKITYLTDTLRMS